VKRQRFVIAVLKPTLIGDVNWRTERSSDQLEIYVVSECGIML